MTRNERSRFSSSDGVGRHVNREHPGTSQPAWLPPLKPEPCSHDFDNDGVCRACGKAKVMR